MVDVESGYGTAPRRDIEEDIKFGASMALWGTVWVAAEIANRGMTLAAEGTDRLVGLLGQLRESWDSDMQPTYADGYPTE